MVITPHSSNSCWWEDCPMHKSWKDALHNLQKSLAGNMPVILCSCFYRSLSSSRNFKSQLINLQRLDHAQTEGTCVYLLPGNFLNYPSAMPSLLTSPLLDHGQFETLLWTPLAWLPSDMCCLCCTVWDTDVEVSLIWYKVQIPNSPRLRKKWQQFQTHLFREKRAIKRNLSILQSVLALNGNRKSLVYRTLGFTTFLPPYSSIYISSMIQLCNSYPVTISH